jgi:phenylpropionate dioxygenase-like ring-hydroxylating dioxygenase large terminal subunit
VNTAADAQKNVTDTQSPAMSEAMIFGVEAYISEAYARAERDKLWRKVWLQAGRVQEIPNTGDYVTFDVLDDSILIVRSAPDKISAYHNVCQHRGRRLVDKPCDAMNACGHTQRFVCGFHGWGYDLEGKNKVIMDKADWKGALSDESLRLPRIKVDTWGGWIWVNMDPNCESLRTYLEPAASVLDPFELEKMRYRWRRWAVFDCNWKVALEAFMESYHVAATHPQFTKYTDWYSWNRAFGKHNCQGYEERENIAATNTITRLGHGDPRISTAEMQLEVMRTVDATTTQTFVDAAVRLVDELPEGTPAEKVMAHWLESAKRDDAARGVVWPTIDQEHLAKSGVAWHIFPNFQVGQSYTTALCYAARPHGYDPDKCVFEASVLERYPEGQEPKTEWVHAKTWNDWPSVLPEDFSNMEAVQQGMKSPGFKGPRPNPYQERSVTNLHRTLAEYMGTGAPHLVNGKSL